jgi:cytochrome c553
MSEKPTRLTIVLAVLAAIGATQAFAGDAEAGKKKAGEICQACHGEGGGKPLMPDYPILAGQHEDYMVATLRKYKNGKRDNPIMKGIVATLSDQDIENVAAYFSRQKGLFLRY